MGSYHSTLFYNFFFPLHPLNSLQIELKDYDPVVHERGFHQKLNLLVKESLLFG
jgi:hypothetical protein